MLMDIFSVAMIVFGGVIIAVGLMIWKNQKMSLIYNYNDKTVKEEDIKAYTMACGKAYALLGLSAMALGAFGLIKNFEFVGTLLWLAGFIISMIMILKAQKKYSVELDD